MAPSVWNAFTIVTRRSIPVSDDRISQINALAMTVQLPWAAEIDNQGVFDPDAIVRKVRWAIQEAH